MAAFNAVGTSTITGRFRIVGEPPGEPVPICPSSCPNNFLQAPTPGKTQVPTYLYATGMTSTTNQCELGTPFAGKAGSVHYQVLDQTGAQMAVAGMTPQSN
jgi:hypothetical protein